MPEKHIRWSLDEEELKIQEEKRRKVPDDCRRWHVAGCDGIRCKQFQGTRTGTQGTVLRKVLRLKIDALLQAQSQQERWKDEDWPSIRGLLDNGAEVNVTASTCNATVLVTALMARDREAMHTLMMMGAHPQAAHDLCPEDDRKGLLEEVVRETEPTRKIRECILEAFHATTVDWSPVFEKAKDLILTGGADVNTECVTRNRETLLFAAAYRKHLGAVRWILRQGARAEDAYRCCGDKFTGCRAILELAVSELELLRKTEDYDKETEELMDTVPEDTMQLRKQLALHVKECHRLHRQLEKRDRELTDLQNAVHGRRTRSRRSM